MSNQPTIYTSIAAKPTLTEAERELLKGKREALLIELRTINRALGIATETRKDRRRGLHGVVE